MIKPITESTNPSPASPTKAAIAIAYGDGIGREIMEATLSILDAAGAALDYDPIAIGQEVYLNGTSSGISEDAWDILRKNRVFLKAPITTPQGGGYKSLNVTLRKSLGLFANVRPVKAYTPFIDCRFPNLDMVIIRENEEDLYAGIEHRQTDEVIQCLKLVSRPGCERIIRYAFEYARANGRRKVTCMTKDNIMKLTDGLFHKTFDEVAKAYPDIENNHFIIDIGSALIADSPERFDVIVTLNLYGDIISDIAAQVAGSVGIAGSANIGQDFAMFEAIHGSAPDIAGKNIANPSGLLQAACMMLVHVGQPEIAAKIQNAWLRAIEDGLHTADIASEAFTFQRIGTREFAQAIIERLGQAPKNFSKVHYPENAKQIQIHTAPTMPTEKELVGVDVFLHWSAPGRDPNLLGSTLESIAGERLKLKMITNRGVKVYPYGLPETFCTDHWRCRFVSNASQLDAAHNHMEKAEKISPADITALLDRLTASDITFIKIENLYTFDGVRGYSLGQGE
jgi:isocitrate dehydrogenase